MTYVLRKNLVNVDDHRHKDFGIIEKKLISCLKSKVKNDNFSKL